MSISNTRLSNWAQLMQPGPSFLFDLGKEGFDVVLDHLVERGLFGSPAFVGSYRVTGGRLHHWPRGRGPHFAEDGGVVVRVC